MEVSKPKEALQILADSHLLNFIGEKILENWDNMNSTSSDWEIFFENQTLEQIIDQLSTSSLVGADNELAIYEWVNEDEVNYVKDEYF